jgi:hypothetical protein
VTETDPPLDLALRPFVESAFPSVWALETFFVLRRRPDAAWSVAEIVAELRGSDTIVRDSLVALERAGLATHGDGEARYQPASPALATLADALAAAYAEKPFTVIGMITSRRSDPLMGFADSFRLGRWRS